MEQELTDAEVDAILAAPWSHCGLTPEQVKAEVARAIERAEAIRVIRQAIRDAAL